MLILEWMVYSVLLSMYAFAAAAFVDRVRRATGRSTRGVWVLAIAASVCIPIGVALRPRSAPLGQVAATVIPEGAQSAPVVNSPTIGIDQFILWFWVVSSMAAFGVLAMGVLQLNTTRRRARRMHLRGREVAITEHVGPGAVAFGLPKILVPRWAVGLAPESMDLLIEHEDEHVRSHDPLIALAATATLVLMPWNPLLWWGVYRLRTAMEVDCDARVLRQGHNIKQYAELLLNIAGRGRTAGLPVLLPFSNNASQLRHRILAMTSSHALSRGKTVFLLLAGASAVFVACETRRPEPLAPVTDVAIVDETARPIRLTDQEATLRKRTIEADLVSKQGGVYKTIADDAMALIVRKSDGTVLHKSNMSEPGATYRMASIPKDNIESVEVIKSKDALPANAKGGVVTVTLKQTSSWTNADAERAAKQMKLGDSPTLHPKSGPVAGTLGKILREKEVQAGATIKQKEEVQGTLSVIREKPKPDTLR